MTKACSASTGTTKMCRKARPEVVQQRNGETLAGGAKVPPHRQGHKEAHHGDSGHTERDSPVATRGCVAPERVRTEQHQSEEDEREPRRVRPDEV